MLTVAAPPATMYLDELSSPDTDCSTDALPINATRYEHSVRCNAGSENFSEAVYLLNRRTATLEAVVGQPDTDEPGKTVRYEIVGDGKLLAAGVLSYGQARPVSVKTVGVLRLVLRVRAQASGTSFISASAAFGDARLTGGADDIAALKAQPR